MLVLAGGTQPRHSVRVACSGAAGLSAACDPIFRGVAGQGAGHFDASPGGEPRDPQNTSDRQSVVSGKSVSVRVDLGGRSFLKKKHTHTSTQNTSPYISISLHPTLHDNIRSGILIIN